VDALVPQASGALPILGHALAFYRDPVGLMERGHREHGLVFGMRLARRRAVVLLGPAHERFFFANTDRLLSIREGMPFFARMFDPDFFSLASAEEYHRQRDLVLPRFRGGQLEAYLPVMDAEIAALVDRLGDRGEFDLVPTLGRLVMRIAGHAFLGPDLGTQLRDGFFAQFRRFAEGIDPVAPDWLPLPRLVRSRRARDSLRATLGGIIEQRRRHPADPPDFLQLLSEARYPDGRRPPDLVLINLVLLLIWAGHETTSGHVSWAVIDLLRHPEELHRVREEQRAVLPDGQPLTLRHIGRLHHLDRVLHESERLHPVAFMQARAAIRPFTLDGYHIPAGTLVILAPSVSHRLPEVFPDPQAYRPGRYLQDPQAMKRLAGFGGGPHRCLGVHFAYLEMALIVTRLLQRYDLRLLDPDPQPLPGLTTKWPRSPCPVRYQTLAAARSRPDHATP
jgi:sterol 14-demethylase